ncbi:hypothetical protein E2P81_ATG00617 [Venturia nashicola]|nr:hypothetical protein E2P81_ATG00617 [Venturia nashicola]
MGGHFAIEVNIEACRLVELSAAGLSVNYDKFEVGDFLHAHDILECTNNQPARGTPPIWFTGWFGCLYYDLKKLIWQCNSVVKLIRQGQDVQWLQSLVFGNAWLVNPCALNGQEGMLVKGLLQGAPAESNTLHADTSGIPEKAFDNV